MSVTLNANPEVMLAIRPCGCRLELSNVVVAFAGICDCGWLVLMKEIR